MTDKIKSLVGWAAAGVASAALLWQTTWGADLLAKSGHSLFEYAAAVLCFLAVDRWLLTGLNIEDAFNRSIPANVRAAIVLAWGVVLYGTLYFWS